MKTRKDAERVVELCKQREKIHELAADIRMGETIGAHTPEKGYRQMPRYESARLFAFTHLADELRELVKREADQQIAEIDKELKKFGVVPDEFDAAAPDDPGVVKMQVLRA